MDDVLPHLIFIQPGGCLIATLGKSELEFAAALIIRWHQARGLEQWTPVSRAQIVELFDAPDPLVAEWARNPFWRPDPHGLVAGGWVEGWKDADDPGTVTPKFLEAVRRWMRKPAAAEAP